MKIIFNNQFLLQELACLQIFFGAKVISPIYENILIKVKGKDLIIYGGDGFANAELIINSNDSLKIMGDDCQCLIPAATFFSILKSLPIGNCELSMAGDQVKLKAVTGHYSLPSQDTLLYPAFEKRTITDTLFFKASDLSYILSHTLPITKADLEYNHLDGVLFNPIQGNLDIVACDYHRLVRLTIPLTGGLEFPKEPPTKFLRRIKMITSGAKEDYDVALSFGGNQVMFSRKNLTVIGVLLDNTFLNYEQLIPITKGHYASMDRVSLINTLERLMLFTDPMENRLYMEVCKEKVRLAGKRSSGNYAVEEIDARFTRESILICFNIQYVHQCLLLLDSPTITLEIHSAEKIVTLRGVNPYVQYYIMPLQSDDLTFSVLIDKITIPSII